MKPTLFIRTVTICAIAALSGVGTAVAIGKNSRPNRGLQCGKGHKKRSKAVGRSCSRAAARSGVSASGPSGTTSDSTTAGTTTSTAPTGNPAQQCRTEQSADPAAFTKKYGTNRNGRNAFGKCVSGKAQEGDDGAPPTTTTTPTSPTTTPTTTTTTPTV